MLVLEEVGLNIDSCVKLKLQVLMYRMCLIQEAANLLDLLDGILIMVNCYLSLDKIHVTKELHQMLVYFHGELFQ